MIIDARGKNCPIPVILAKKEIDSKSLSFSILVDNAIAVENLKKLARSQGYKVEFKGVNEDYSVDFIGDETTHSVTDLKELSQDHDTDLFKSGPHWVLFIGKDAIGEGDPALGESLIKMYFYTLSQGNCLPKAILFMNNGVKLPTTNSQVIDHLKTIADKGCEILVCGACLDFYNLTDQLQVGSISNMYAITEEINKASKVVTL